MASPFPVAVDRLMRLEGVSLTISVVILKDCNGTLLKVERQWCYRF